MKAVLFLEDGRSFPGETISGQGESTGELILNTAVVGYQEMLTDPAYAAQILVLTYPLIGNYGVAPKFNESQKIWLSGLVIKERARIFSNWQAKDSFDNFARENNLTVIQGIDTRTLAVHLRQKGQMLGVISNTSFDSKELLVKIERFRKKREESLLPKISNVKPMRIGRQKARHKVAVLNLGITNSIIRQLETLGFAITVLAYNARPQEILRLKPNGLIISGGPEEDAGLKDTVENVKELIGKLPILGIATGSQVLARALGAKTSKLKLGHHGLNYPLGNPLSYKGEITAQNHSYVIDAESLAKKKEVRITGLNLNDRSIEEFESKKLKFIGAQYSPVSPGFNEPNALFKRFINMMKK